MIEASRDRVASSCPPAPLALSPPCPPRASLARPTAATRPRQATAGPRTSWATRPFSVASPLPPAPMRHPIRLTWVLLVSPLQACRRLLVVATCMSPLLAARATHPGLQSTLLHLSCCGCSTALMTTRLRRMEAFDQATWGHVRFHPTCQVLLRWGMSPHQALPAAAQIQ